VQLFHSADGKLKRLGLLSVLRDVAAGLEYLHSKKVSKQTQLFGHNCKISSHHDQSSDPR
jgi:hypothetical protein